MRKAFIGATLLLLCAEAQAADPIPSYKGPYTIRRRPAPSSPSRAITLPAGVVIDLTSWAGTRERSRVPAGFLSPYTGAVDIMINPDGSILPTTVYSSPSSFSMDSAFIHLWIADRSDLAAPSPVVSSAPYLPVAKGILPGRFPSELQHDYALITVFSRTGRISTSSNMPFLFDPTLGYTNTVTTGINPLSIYSANNPFVQPQQGSLSPR